MSRSPKAKGPNGFTLVELLLATALIPVVALAIFGNLNSGIKLWQRLTQEDSTENLAIFYQKVSQDFDQCLKYTGVSFVGEKDKVYFASLVHARPQFGDFKTAGEIRYYYDLSRKIIFKEERDLGHLYKEEKGTQTVLAQRVGSFILSYFALDPADKKYKWMEAFLQGPTNNTLPIAVRMEFESLDSGETFTRTFLIPTGGGG